LVISFIQQESVKINDASKADESNDSNHNQLKSYSSSGLLLNMFYFLLVVELNKKRKRSNTDSEEFEGKFENFNFGLFVIYSVKEKKILKKIISL
jgi:hypothetical protein